MNREQILTWLLRLAGVITITAFGAIFLPVEWMAAGHEWLGLGEFPATAVVDYLTRSIAGLYGFHGVLLLLVSTDTIRYRLIVRYLGVMNIVFGLIVLGVDLHAGLPLFWTLGEGPPVIAFGIVILALAAGTRRSPADGDVS